MNTPSISSLKKIYAHTDTSFEDLLHHARVIEDVLAEGFGVKNEILKLREQAQSFALLSKIKRNFVHRYALKTYKYEDVLSFDHRQFDFKDELDFAKNIEAIPPSHPTYDTYARYAAWATLTGEGKELHKEGTLFKQPELIDFANLLKADIPPAPSRDGFELTDTGIGSKHASDAAHYCIVCHKQGKDSCSKGMPSKAEEEPFKRNPLGVDLAGCPLDQKISEMNALYQEGCVIAALAVAMIDNPMLCLTGHRICNDCMKTCIYQKQSPVNIPGIESDILKTVLNLPYGFEIYDTLSRWNPLHTKRPESKPPSGYKILVVGSGPAGINLAYHLLEEGHDVVMIEGARVEPLPSYASPVKNIHDVTEDLNHRTPKGFGGVAEYGITVRWDKNNLTLARMLLERRERFTLLGGVRFGGNLTTKQAFDDIGFDHIALCCGAGKPKILNIKNSDAKGVRYASDFLMTLQQGGAFLDKGNTHLDITLPCVVIGGGLTSIDTATEVLAYYPRYVQKIAMATFKNLSPLEESQRAMIVSHHTLFEEERRRAQSEDRSPNFHPIFKEIGGVTLLYRKNIKDSPAYKLNHEELAHGLSEGITLMEETEPLEVIMNDQGQAEALRIKTKDKESEIPAKSILIATGTFGNTNILEDESIYDVENFYLKEQEDFVAYTHHDHKKVTFFGDMHPKYHGSVVKAMASAKHGYPHITRALQSVMPTPKNDFHDSIKKALTPHVIEVTHLSERIYEVTIHAPLLAKNFHPGQFFKLQNFKSDNFYGCEPVAATGARVDLEKGLITTILLDIGHSTHILKHLKPGDAVSLMGPTGASTHIPSHKKILLIGGGVGNAVHFTIGRQALLQHCHVTLVAGFKNKEDLFLQDELEACSSRLVLACDEGALPINRPQDKNIHGNILHALEHIDNLRVFEHTLVIGSAGLMHAVQKFLKSQDLKADMIASINAPMQCMMKGVCAQCLQKQEDGTVIFTCAQQDQCMNEVDFESLKRRLSQNSLSEKMVVATGIEPVTPTMST